MLEEIPVIWPIRPARRRRGAIGIDEDSIQLDERGDVQAQKIVLQVMEEGARRNFTAELSMTLEDNVMVNRFIETMGAKRYKTYRIYHRPIS